MSSLVFFLFEECSTVQWLLCLMEITVHSCLSEWYRLHLCILAAKVLKCVWYSVFQLLWNYKLNLTTDPKFESVAVEVCKSTISDVSNDICLRTALAVMFMAALYFFSSTSKSYAQVIFLRWLIWLVIRCLGNRTDNILGACTGWS